MVNPCPVRAVAVTGGKGGVGKTNVSVNLGVAAAELGQKVMLLDADLGLANIDVVLGLHPQGDLSHVLRGESTLEDILVEGPSGLKVIPGASGVTSLASLTPAEHTGLIRAFSEVAVDTELLIVDTAAGISEAVLSFSRASHANMVRSAQEGRELYNKMCRVSDRYLDVTLSFMGSIPYDDSLRKAVKTQRPVVQAFPRSRVAQAFRNLAKKIETWPQPGGANGQVQFFVERLIKYSSDYGEMVL